MRKLSLFVCLASFALVSCQEKPYTQNRGFAQGTTYNIIYEGSENLQEQIDSLLEDFDFSLSTYNPESVISKINHNQSKATDWKFDAVFTKAKEIHQQTKGLFDITVGPVVNAYGFGRTEASHITPELIDSLLNYVGMEKVLLKNGELIKKHPNIRIDVNAIAQGYSVDLVAKFLEEKGKDNYLVEIGGELLTKGKNKRGKVWRVGLDKPADGNMTPGAQVQAIIELKNRALATSGNYRKFLEQEGEKYVHSINPITGEARKHNLLSTTIISKDCMTADAMATACMILGLEKAFELIEQQKDMEAYFIYSDAENKFQVKMTEGMKKYLE